MNSFTTRFAIVPLLLTSAISARANEVPFGPLYRYLDNETVVVATARIDAASIAQLEALIEPLMVTPVDRAMLQKAKPMLELLADRRLFVLGGVNDFVPGSNGPLIIATAIPGETKFKEFTEKLQSQLLDGVKPEFAAEVRLVEMNGLFSNVAALIGSKAALERFDAIEPQPRPDLVKPLTKFVESNTPVAAVFAPGPDARRVLREMWPQLPAPFSAVTGPLLADRVKQFTFTAQLPPQWSAELAIHTSDDETAQTLAQTGRQAVTMFAPLIQSQPALKGIDLEQIVETASPKQEGAAVTLAVRHDDAIVAKAIANLAAQAIDDARKKAQRMQRMNQFKQLALAFHNFHDSQKGYPSTATICDKNGKPLLSWRVAILPFLGTDANALFNQFHFDEPWDSEHNLTLLEKMPEVYADPARPDHGGKTTYVLPVHPETTFPPADDSAVAETTFTGRKLFLRPGFSYRDVTDGTSQTIMIVDVSPDRAVPWTKPADWEADLAHPLEGLKQEDRDGFVSAFCDGSAHFISFDVSPEILKKIFTRAGREIIDERY